MASGHSTASRQGQSISPLEERGVRGLPRHVEEPRVANAMIEAGTAFRSRCGLCAGRVVSPEPVGHPVGVLRAPRHTVSRPLPDGGGRVSERDASAQPTLGDLLQQWFVRCQTAPQSATPLRQ